MGPIVFEAREISGWIDAEISGSEVVAGEGSPSAELEVRLTALRSGNDLYDAELRRRIDARRFPSCVLHLERTTPLDGGAFSLGGSITFHGTTRSLTGTMDVQVSAEGQLAITGEKELDIRDFDLRPPGMLMMKIYPEVQVQMFIAAAADDGAGGSG